MKKSICILLTLVMLLGLCACGKKTASAETPAAAAVPAAEQPAAALASEPAAAEPAQAAAAPAPVYAPDEGFAVPACGFAYVYPEEYKNASGIIRMMEQASGSDSVVLELVYIPTSEERHQAFLDFEKILGDEGLTLPALFQNGYMVFTLFKVYADRADAATAKLIADDMSANAASEDMIYVGQTKASADWYCSVMRLLPMEKEPDTFRQNMGDAFDEYMAFARDKDLVLSGFTSLQ